MITALLFFLILWSFIAALVLLNLKTSMWIPGKNTTNNKRKRTKKNKEKKKKTESTKTKTIIETETEAETDK